MARFLADENIPKSVVVWLNEQGYDTVRAQDKDLAGAKDSELASWSIENDSMILTIDEDFVRLRKQNKSLGVILIRTHPPKADKINQLLSALLPKIRLDKHMKDLLIISDRGIRIESSGLTSTQ